MITAPLPHDEERRLEVLRSYAVLDTPPEKGFDDITRLAALICEVPIALVSLVDRNRQWFKSRFGLSAHETPRDIAFCSHAILGTAPLIVGDALQDERFHDNPLVAGDPLIRFYAGAPLSAPGGERLGTLCVIDRRPRALTAGQLEGLEILARHVIAQLELRNQTARLARTARTLSESEDRFRLLSDAAPVGIFLATSDGRRMYANPELREISGQSVEQCFGLGWLDSVHQEDRSRVLAEWQQAVEQEREFRAEFRSVLPDGSERYLLSRARRADEKHWVGASNDITERRAIELALADGEQRLRLVMEGSADGYYDWNLPTGRMRISGRWESMLGYEAEEITPHIDSWTSLVHPDDRPHVWRALEEHFEGRKHSYETTYRLRTKSGTWRWILDRGKVVSRDPGGKPLRFAGTHTDIDEKKRAEEMLDRFFSLSIEMLCVAGLDGYFKRVNPAFEKILGYSTLELLTRPFLDLVHPDDRERTQKELERLGAGETTLRFENRYLCADGSIRWIAWTASPYVEEELVYAAGRDITEAKLTAQTLAESEDRYRDLFENATDLIQSLTPDGKFLYVNRAWLQTLGYTKDEVAQLHMFDVVDPSCKEHFARLLAGEELNKVVTELRTKSGEKRIVEGNVSCRFDDGRPVSTRGIFRDITESRSAEQELMRSNETLRARESALRSIVASSLSGIVTLSRAGAIASVNAAAERILGFKEEELLGRDVVSLLPELPENIAEFQRRSVDASLGKVTEWPVRRGDGRIIMVELALFEFETAEGKQLAGNIQDVSEKREVERMKREFVATVSHELRTPLTSIRGSLDLLTGGVFGQLPGGAEEVATIALRNTTRLITLINDILDLERLDSGKLELHFGAAEAGTMMLAAVEAVRAFAEQNGVAIEVLPSPAIVRADADRLIQVLVNLLSNAVKFSEAGSVVRVEARQEDEELLFRVEDHGRGIPSDYLQRVFDRFQQVESSDSRTKGGSGLGLAICKAIVEQHNGSIGVISEEGTGSVFWVRLPLVVKPATGIRIGLFTSSAEATPVARLLYREGHDVLPLDTWRQVRAAVEARSVTMLIMELSDDAEAGDFLSRLRSAQMDYPVPIIVVASSTDAIRSFDDNMTVFVPRGRDRELLEAVRNFAEDRGGPDVLIVEDDFALLGLMQKQLAGDDLRIRVARTGGAAVAMARKGTPRLMVLDIGLPDIDGFDVISILSQDERMRTMPLLIYTGRELDDSARERLTLGPTRFVAKGINGDTQFRTAVLEMLEQICEC